MNFQFYQTPGLLPQPAGGMSMYGGVPSLMAQPLVQRGMAPMQPRSHPMMAARMGIRAQTPRHFGPGMLRPGMQPRSLLGEGAGAQFAQSAASLAGAPLRPASPVTNQPKPGKPQEVLPLLPPPTGQTQTSPAAEITKPSPEAKKRPHEESPRNQKNRAVEQSGDGAVQDMSSTTNMLDFYNSDMHVKLDPDGYGFESINQPSGFCFCWGGARGTYGLTSGKVCFEVRITDQLPVDFGADHKEEHPHVVRVGWSVDSHSLQLGEDPLSYGYGGTGRFSVNCRFQIYGKPFQKGDVIMGLVDYNTKPITVSYCKNGTWLGVAARVNDLKDKALFPHVLLKNCRVEVNFGQRTAWYPPPPGYVFIDTVPVEKRVRGMKPPEKKSDCEIIMIVGLPGSGKTTWGLKMQTEKVDKRYNIIGTDTLIDKMKVNGLPRKNNYHGRWDVLISKATDSLNKLFGIASRRNRNYILDQTNVYPTARKRKMRNFEGFKRICAVLQPHDPELKRREWKRTHADGKFVPEDAVFKMKANYALPQDSDPHVDEIMWIELDRKMSQDLVDQYVKEGVSKVSPKDVVRPFRTDNRGGGRRDQHGQMPKPPPKQEPPPMPKNQPPPPPSQSPMGKDAKWKDSDLGGPAEKRSRSGSRSALDSIKLEYEESQGDKPDNGKKHDPSYKWQGMQVKQEPGDRGQNRGQGRFERNFQDSRDMGYGDRGNSSGFGQTPMPQGNAPWPPLPPKSEPAESEQSWKKQDSSWGQKGGRDYFSSGQSSQQTQGGYGQRDQDRGSLQSHDYQKNQPWKPPPPPSDKDASGPPRFQGGGYDNQWQQQQQRWSDQQQQQKQPPQSGWQQDQQRNQPWKQEPKDKQPESSQWGDYGQRDTHAQRDQGATASSNVKQEKEWDKDQYGGSSGGGGGGSFDKQQYGSYGNQQFGSYGSQGGYGKDNQFRQGESSINKGKDLGGQIGGKGTDFSGYSSQTGRDMPFQRDQGGSGNNWGQSQYGQQTTGPTTGQGRPSSVGGLDQNQWSNKPSGAPSMPSWMSQQADWGTHEQGGPPDQTATKVVGQTGSGKEKEKSSRTRKSRWGEKPEEEPAVTQPSDQGIGWGETKPPLDILQGSKPPEPPMPVPGDSAPSAQSILGSYGSGGNYGSGQTIGQFVERNEGPKFGGGRPDTEMSGNFGGTGQFGGRTEAGQLWSQGDTMGGRGESGQYGGRSDSSQFGGRADSSRLGLLSSSGDRRDGGQFVSQSSGSNFGRNENDRLGGLREGVQFGGRGEMAGHGEASQFGGRGESGSFGSRSDSQFGNQGGNTQFGKQGQFAGRDDNMRGRGQFEGKSDLGQFGGRGDSGQFGGRGESDQFGGRGDRFGSSGNDDSLRSGFREDKSGGMKSSNNEDPSRYKQDQDNSPSMGMRGNQGGSWAGSGGRGGGFEGNNRDSGGNAGGFSGGYSSGGFNQMNMGGNRPMMDSSRPMGGGGMTGWDDRFSGSSREQGGRN